MLRTPVALIIFNRPNLTERVFAEIAKAKPTRLFIIADGPRVDRPGEADRCAEARKIAEGVDWDCEVVCDYATANQGPGKRIASGITNAFQQVEELIVLEDDCVPDSTFFPFCDELLEKYRHDERVIHIAGNHFQGGSRRPTPYSYSFARWNIAWGWATWRRAWRYFDLELGLWSELRETNFLDVVLQDPRAVRQYRKIFDDIQAEAGESEAWDHAWTFTCWSRGAFSVLPSTTLVSHVGYGPDATHFGSAPNDPRACLRTEAIAFPLQHPSCLLYDRAADEFIIKTYIIPKPPPALAKRLYNRLRRGVAEVVPSRARRVGKQLLSYARHASVR